MSEIVYLFGAGASANALPIVNQMPERIAGTISVIESGKIGTEMINIEVEKKKNLIDQLHWLKEGCEKYATVDTYAKKLYVTDKNDYKRLKHVLSAYLTLEQIINKPDMRYDAFFASLLGETIDDLPKNISVLSWNYDCQFELAFSEYANKRGLNDIWQHLNITSKKKNKTTNVNAFSITKLNGTALMEIDGNNLLDPFYGNHRMNGIINAIHNLYFEYAEGSNIVNHLSFAWDKDNTKVYYQSLVPKITDARVLVVIGYSFPFFNRRHDKWMFQEMKSLSKIYIQTPNPEEVDQSMRTVLSSSQIANISSKKNIVQLPKVEQFYLPAEL